MDPANGQEALREIGEDIEEGADLIIAKPALAYMDIMKEASMKYNIPIVAYNVSGEYAMVKAAAANGWIDEKKIVMENMVEMCIRDSIRPDAVKIGMVSSSGLIKTIAERLQHYNCLLYTSWTCRITNRSRENVCTARSRKAGLF